jgi:hypothetical protein
MLATLHESDVAVGIRRGSLLAYVVCWRPSWVVGLRGLLASVVGPCWPASSPGWPMLAVGVRRGSLLACVGSQHVRPCRSQTYNKPIYNRYVSTKDRCRKKTHLGSNDVSRHLSLITAISPSSLAAVGLRWPSLAAVGFCWSVVRGHRCWS